MALKEGQLITDEKMMIRIDPEKIEMGTALVELEEESHEKLLEYLMVRLNSANSIRTSRIQRYAKIDQMVAGWQKLSKEDSVRSTREEMTGQAQALPINLTVTKSHVDDAVAFFTEVFAPLGGNFFANPGKKEQTATVQKLTKKMDQDMKSNGYYDSVVSTMTSLSKYNVGGFHISWTDDSSNGKSVGNVCKSIDQYNFLYDTTIKDVSKLHTDGEYSAIIEEKNRLWIIREAKARGLMNLEKVLEHLPEDKKSNSFLPNKARFYKHPPSQTRMSETGSDSKSGMSDDNVDWEGFGLGLAEDKMATIQGHEIVTMYCWIIPSQFDIEQMESEGNENDLQLWQFQICDSKAIIFAAPIENAIELPTVLGRLDKDEMGEAARTMAENVIPFQRIISFLLNTAIEGIRSDIWGIKGYDPNMFDISNVQNGETSGWLKSKKPGADVRAGMIKLDSGSGTEKNFEHAARVMELMRSMYPAQAMPTQIAGMDRAVSSQVAAVMQGAMRKMHMLVRRLDSILMFAVRMSMYRNIVQRDPEKQDFSSLKAEEIAEILSGGLGQVNREAAAEQLRSLIFALIQNPDGNQGVDVRGLFTLWSVLMNLGTDLGEFIQQVAAEGMVPPGIDPATGQPTQGDPNAAAPVNPATQAGGIPQQ